MESIHALYRIGIGPSSSHTMGPRYAAEIFKQRYPNAKSFRATLYGSLAATGKGHLTDWALNEAFDPISVEIIWRPDEFLPLHPNGLELAAFDEEEKPLGDWQIYSIGGGALRDATTNLTSTSIYSVKTMADCLNWSENNQAPLWQLVTSTEGEDIWFFLQEIWQTMLDSINRGLKRTEFLPGCLGLARKSHIFYKKALSSGLAVRPANLIFAYALAVSEENASGGKIVTAPTCGSCGILPAVLRFLQKNLELETETILQALATAALIGNLVKSNGSISGAEVGCQGEVGTACSMAAAAATQILGGTPAQIEYAAEMGFEHHLGLTCDPVAGLVQIPCIERNAFAATRALDCAEYALVAGGQHRISFDEVVTTMQQTGHDLNSCYRETSTGGLATICQLPKTNLKSSKHD